MSRSLEDLLLGDVVDEIPDDAAASIGDKLVTANPPQVQPPPPTQPPQQTQPTQQTQQPKQVHTSLPTQSGHIPQMQNTAVNRTNVPQPQQNRQPTPQMAPRVGMHGMQTQAGAQPGQPNPNAAGIQRPGMAVQGNPNTNNSKQQSFVRFMEIVKTKLPADQCVSVGEIDKLFMEHKISFEDYLSQLRAKIGKIKFELLLNQFKSLQNGQKPAPPTMTTPGATSATPGQHPQQVQGQSSQPSLQTQRPPVRTPLTIPSNFPQTLNQPQSQIPGGPQGYRRPDAVPVTLQNQNQKKRLEPSTPSSLQEPPNKKRPMPNMPLTNRPSQVNMTVTPGSLNQKQQKQKDEDMKSFDDVTKIAKINLKEEQKLSLEDEQGPVTNYPSEGKETLFVNEPVIEKIVKDIANKHSLAVGDQLVEYLALCLQEKLRGSMEQLIALSKQRVDLHRADFQIEETSDVKKTLRFISERERELALKKKEEDRERLLLAAKQNKKEKKDDKQSAFFRDKLNKVKQEEEEKRTNITALQAAKSTTRPSPIGQSGLFGGLTKQDLPVYLRQIPSSTLSSGLPNQAKITTSIADVPRQPTRKITYKDALAYVERDVDLRGENSNFVYKCFLGEELLRTTKHERGSVISN